MHNTLTDKIKILAETAGIDAIGYADASEFEEYALKNSPRADPKRSLSSAKSIIVVGIYIGGLTLPTWTNPWYGRTSRLYLSGYFLDVVKPLRPIIELLEREGFKAVPCEMGSTLPLKLAAVRAGLGWQGKNTLLISKKYGTFLALGGILTDAKLDYNQIPETDHCAKCNKCQKSCPMKALDKPYVLNREQCISHLLQGENLPDRVRGIMENRVIDCEICQDSCPWNFNHIKKSMITETTKSFQKMIKNWERFFYLPDFTELPVEGYRAKLADLNAGIPYHIIKRNALIALENAKKTEKKDAH